MVHLPITTQANSPEGTEGSFLEFYPPLCDPDSDGVTCLPRMPDMRHRDAGQLRNGFS